MQKTGGEQSAKWMKKGLILKEKKLNGGEKEWKLFFNYL